MARKKKAQVELEEQILLEEHELGLHDGDVDGCVLCEEEEEIPPDAPRFVNPVAAGSGRVSKASTPEMVLVINEIDVIADIRAGVSPGNLSERVGMSRSKLRRTVDKKFGKGTYASLRDSSKQVPEAPSKDQIDLSRKRMSKLDRGVPRIPTASCKEGWRYRTIFVDYGGRRLKNLPSNVAHDPSVAEMLLTDPDGVEYVRARNDEAADLIIDEAAEKIGLDPVRLRKFETSFMYHLVKKNERLIKQGEKSLERTRRQKRIRRKGGI